MYFKKISTFCIALIFLGVLTVHATTVSKEFRKTFDFPAKGHVHIKTLNGRIDVISWDKEAVEVFADIKVKNRNHRDASDLLEKIEIIIDKQDDEVSIEANFPGRRSGGGFLDWVFGGDNQVTVDFYIKVPRQTNIDLKSTNGRIIVEDIEGDAKLSTTNGSVEAEKMKGSLDGHTTNGSIFAKVNRFDKNDEISLGTTNGSIKLILPSEIKADVRASTVNGSIQTDFPLTVQGKFIRKKISGEIGGGGGLIELSTVNGSISILE